MGVFALKDGLGLALIHLCIVPDRVLSACIEDDWDTEVSCKVVSIADVTYVTMSLDTCYVA